MSYGLSYSDTDHYYIGSERDDGIETNVAPATLGVEQVLGIEYDAAPRLTLVGEIPFVHTEQSREFGGVAGTMKASGLGDVRLLARYWIADRRDGLRWYASAGLRLPTGESDGTFRAQNGSLVTKDLAAQAGTGNYAGILEVGGSRPIGPRFALGFSARYVFTPEATTVNNFRHELTGNGPEKNSDSDAANARLTLSAPLGSGNGRWSRLAARVLADVAWVPYDDLIGETEGFRRAGPIVLAGPGLSWAPGEAWSLSAAVPLTVYRDVQRNGGNVQEWSFLLSASYDILPGEAGGS
ncbi:MAG: hypothetical protein GF328_10065 [Candidatus Latescibacteria bacterium]|nr:hypothetical protein [Candidatus Latescibacterota bacterium]